VADVGDDPADVGVYCRAVEAHLCRRNTGHLVRIVGPSFDLVSGWAERGVPLSIACGGIDRYVDRQAAKGPRRRPIRIEFCEADVLDLFDEWRRAIGVSRWTEGDDSAPARRAPPLPAHLERVVARLTALRARADVAPSLATAVDGVVGELDAAMFGAKGLRGDARAAFLCRLGQLDAHLLTAAREGLDAAALADLSRQAEQELRAFRDRMTPDAHAAAVAAQVDRLVRERYQLPFVSLD
jgi:hypothetical protein